jgi:DNA-binding MurR/RpiR family transcriptional regulator
MFPAKNFETLRQQAILIRQGEIELKMGKKSLNALTIMVEEPDLVALNNIVDLAKKTSISPASITRISRLLGYESFHLFQQVFRQRAKSRSDYYTDKLKNLIENKSDQPKQLLRAQAQSAISNIEYCLKHTSDQSLSQATFLLATTRRVFVFGHKQSSAVASILEYGLSLIRFDVHRLLQSEHGAAIAVGQLRKHDLLVIIGSSPYASLTREIVYLALKQECKILAITDSELSPLCEHAMQSLIIPTDGDYYNNSLSATLIVIESLLSLTAVKLDQSAVRKLNDHEITLQRLTDSN